MSRTDTIMEWANFANETRAGYGGQSMDDLADLDEDNSNSLSVKIKTFFRYVAGIIILLVVLL